MTGLWSHPDVEMAPFSFVSSRRWPPFRIHVKASFSATGNYAFARSRSNFVSVGHDGKEMRETEGEKEKEWEKGIKIKKIGEKKWKKKWSGERWGSRERLGS